MASELNLGRVKGTDGAPGTPGKDGKSAYQAAVDAGYTGTEEEFNTALAGMQDAPFLPLSGGEMAGNIDFKNHSLSGLSTVGFNKSSTATVEFGMDLNFISNSDVLAMYLDSYFIYMNWTLSMNRNKIIDLGDPAFDTDAVNKKYVDGLVGNINSVLDAINGEVV